MNKLTNPELPDVRDGLTRKQRIVLNCLHRLQQETGKTFIPTPMLYGRVVETMEMSVDEMQGILQQLLRHH